MAAGKFIAYYRVSTAKQGASGLGLEAQQAAVKGYLNGGQWELLAEFTETESGKSEKNRPQLQAALAECKRQKATLVVAKLDRLARNVHFISHLTQSGIDFVAADMPTVNKLTVHILAAVAEHEREMISERTKAALAAAKARGKALGRNGATLAKANKNEANRHAQRIEADVRRLRPGRTIRELTEALNAENVPTLRGGLWWPSSTYRMLDRLGLR